MKKIAILGSTGSIGTQTLDIVSQFPDRFRATVLIAGHNVDLLIRQCLRHRPALAVIADQSKYQALKEALAPIGIETAAGDEAVAQAMERPEFDTVVTATVGYSGLLPTVHAIKAGKEIALANKETLVVAGELVKKLLKQSQSTIIPVDSEHSAIYQCINGEDPSTIQELIITASGGPFRTLSYHQLEAVTLEQALNHPNWNMGAKITIDSATMMNKAFEIVEAHWLFDIPRERIDAVVHPQSIVHSMVSFIDGAVKAQLGIPDMHLPIRYALGDATRLPAAERPLVLADMTTLTFERPDHGRFPCISLADTALSLGGTAACIINAANEVAVSAFLHGVIKFTQIYPTITATLQEVGIMQNPGLDDYVATSAEATRKANEILKRKEISVKNWNRL